MESQSNKHQGGNKEVWRDSRVKDYDNIQSLLSEKKQEEQENVARIINYFCGIQKIINPLILDVGCGPGTPITMTKYVLDKVPGCSVTGADGSEEMIEAAVSNLAPVYGNRFSGVFGDFNSEHFWDRQLDRQYDFIISSSALHYLSDKRRPTFLKEVFEHLNTAGALIIGMASRSEHPAISEMQQVFRLEFTHNKLKELGKNQSFAEFWRSSDEKDSKANINWQSNQVWLEAIRKAGFSGADTVWQVWVKSLIVAVK